MAGLVGILKEDEQEIVAQKLQRIDHRGLGGSMVRSVPGATFGWNWPPAQAAQAFGHEHIDGIFDGEIYNWSDLSPQAIYPLQALVAAYHEKGQNFLKKLDGPFALALCGPGGVLLARDRLGVKPMYYGYCDGVLCFASEIKALIGWAQSVQAFPPGCFWRGKGVMLSFAPVQNPQAVSASIEEIRLTLRHKLLRAVQKRLGRGELGVWLSGGLDSAALTVLARPLVPALHTFSVGLADSPDLRFSGRLAQELGTNHHQRICTLADLQRVLPQVIYHLESFDALLVRSSMLNFLLAELAAEYVPAVLSGEGADELFAGYAFLKKLEQEQLNAELQSLVRQLHNTALQRVDRCAAAYNLVAHTPFLDWDVVDYAMQIPSHLKLDVGGKKIEKWILRQAMEGLLPDSVQKRPKEKFWQGGGVKELLGEYAEGRISDRAFAAERTLMDGSKLNSKEELLYYRIFREHFGDIDTRHWMGRTKG
ncbi:asparagine synthase [candidate division KSB1 bacterium]|nr:asparagine synthase [candidate division KSB1 bacterium]